VSVDFPGSPTDHAIIAVYTTLDDTPEVWDLIPMMEFLLENTTDPNRISFLVTGVYKFRVGVRRSGPPTRSAFPRSTAPRSRPVPAAIRTSPPGSIMSPTRSLC
jgi:hypothetical protein